MNRRTFLTRFAKGLVAATALLHIPEQITLALPLGEEVRSTAALEMLRRAFNTWTGVNRVAPQKILLGQRLYDRIESEMLSCQRFTPFDDGRPISLLFKGVRCVLLRYPPEGDTWTYEFCR